MFNNDMSKNLNKGQAHKGKKYNPALWAPITDPIQTAALKARTANDGIKTDISTPERAEDIAEQAKSIWLRSQQGILEGNRLEIIAKKLYIDGSITPKIFEEMHAAIDFYKALEDRRREGLFKALLAPDENGHSAITQAEIDTYYPGELFIEEAVIRMPAFVLDSLASEENILQLCVKAVRRILGEPLVKHEALSKEILPKVLEIDDSFGELKAQLHGFDNKMSLLRNRGYISDEQKESYQEDIKLRNVRQDALNKKIRITFTEKKLIRASGNNPIGINILTTEKYLELVRSANVTEMLRQFVDYAPTETLENGNERLKIWREHIPLVEQLIQLGLQAQQAQEEKNLNTISTQLISVQAELEEVLGYPIPATGIGDLCDAMSKVPDDIASLSMEARRLQAAGLLSLEELAEVNQLQEQIISIFNTVASKLSVLNPRVMERDTGEGIQSPFTEEEWDGIAALENRKERFIAWAKRSPDLVLETLVDAFTVLWNMRGQAAAVVNPVLEIEQAANPGVAMAGVSALTPGKQDEVLIVTNAGEDPVLTVRQLYKEIQLLNEVGANLTRVVFPRLFNNGTINQKLFFQTVRIANQCDKDLESLANQTKEKLLRKNRDGQSAMTPQEYTFYTQKIMREAFLEEVANRLPEVAIEVCEGTKNILNISIDSIKDLAAIPLEREREAVEHAKLKIEELYAKEVELRALNDSSITEIERLHQSNFLTDEQSKEAETLINTCGSDLGKMRQNLSTRAVQEKDIIVQHNPSAQASLFTDDEFARMKSLHHENRRAFLMALAERAPSNVLTHITSTVGLEQKLYDDLNIFVGLGLEAEKVTITAANPTVPTPGISPEHDRFAAVVVESNAQQVASALPLLNDTEQQALNESLEIARTFTFEQLNQDIESLLFEMQMQLGERLYFECSLDPRRASYPITLRFSNPDGREETRILTNYDSAFGALGLSLRLTDAVDMKILVQSLILNTDEVSPTAPDVSKGYTTIKHEQALPQACGQLKPDEVRVVESSNGIYTLKMEVPDPYSRLPEHAKPLITITVPLGLPAIDKSAEELAEREDRKREVLNFLKARDTERRWVSRADIETHLREDLQKPWATSLWEPLPGPPDQPDLFKKEIIIKPGSDTNPQEVTIRPLNLSLDLGGDNPSWNLHINIYERHIDDPKHAKHLRSRVLNLHTKNKELALARASESVMGIKTSGGYSRKGFLPELEAFVNANADETWERKPREVGMKPEVHIGDVPLKNFFDDMLRYEDGFRIDATQIGEAEIIQTAQGELERFPVTFSVMRSFLGDFGGTVAPVPEKLRESDGDNRRPVECTIILEKPLEKSIAAEEAIVLKERKKFAARYAEKVNSEFIWPLGEIYSSIALGTSDPETGEQLESQRKVPQEYHTATVRNLFVAAVRSTFGAEATQNCYGNIRTPSHAGAKLVRRNKQQLQPS